MDQLIPMDATATEDSSTKYRLAAKIGQTSGSKDTCQKYYSLCTYSSDQIISLGNQVEASQPLGLPLPATGTQQQPLQRPPAVQQSMSMSVTSSSSSVTAMPRV